LDAIESELAQLRGVIQGAKGIPADGWRKAIEKYAGDEDLLSVFAEAMKLREADRSHARKLRRTAPRAKK